MKKIQMHRISWPKAYLKKRLREIKAALNLKLGTMSIESNFFSFQKIASVLLQVQG